MPGKKRKHVIDYKEVATYRQKLRRPAGTPLKLTNRERKKFTVKSPFPQHFSLPSNILRYIALNPVSPNGHLKLISTCKSLLRMSQILPFEVLYHFGNTDDDEDCYKWRANNRDIINLKKHSFKLWIHDEVSIWTDQLTGSMTNLASTLVKHIYMFTLREINLQNQVLSFEDLKILISGGNLKTIGFDRSLVKNSDGSVTPFEAVFELICCENIEIILHPEQHGIGRSTSKKIMEILSSDQVPGEIDMCLSNIPQSFCLDSVSEFLKKNTTGRQHTLDLFFSTEISDAYKNQLQQIVNEIIQYRGIYAHTVPIISFPGNDFGAYSKLVKMRHDAVEGILRRP